jgi:hypothetical protein
MGGDQSYALLPKSQLLRFVYVPALPVLNVLLYGPRES